MRTFITGLLVTLLGSFYLSSSNALPFAPAKYELGVHYKRVPNPRPTSQPEVTEVFWLGCGHCYRLEAKLEDWLKRQPKNSVKFTREPAMFGRPWVLHAHLYFVAKQLGKSEKMIPLAFEQIHEKGNRLLTKAAQQAFLQEALGVTVLEFENLFDSESVRQAMVASNQKVRALGLSGVPAIIVNGEFLVDATSAGGQDNMLDVVDYLLKN